MEWVGGKGGGEGGTAGLLERETGGGGLEGAWGLQGRVRVAVVWRTKGQRREDVDLGARNRQHEIVNKAGQLSPSKKKAPASQAIDWREKQL